MTAKGWYNHYDDPEEFWDEEPLVRPSLTPPAVTPQHNPTTPASSFAPPSHPHHTQVNVSEKGDSALTGRSADHLVAVRVDALGSVVDISLAMRLCDRAVPAWSAAQQIDTTAHAIVGAVNAARREAAKTRHASAFSRGLS